MKLTKTNSKQRCVPERAAVLPKGSANRVRTRSAPNDNGNAIFFSVSQELHQWRVVEGAKIAEDINPSDTNDAVGLYTYGDARQANAAVAATKDAFLRGRAQAFNYGMKSLNGSATRSLRARMNLADSLAADRWRARSPPWIPFGAADQIDGRQKGLSNPKVPGWWRSSSRTSR
jgi:hypothetical protein